MLKLLFYAEYVRISLLFDGNEVAYEMKREIVTAPWNDQDGNSSAIFIYHKWNVYELQESNSRRRKRVGGMSVEQVKKRRGGGGGL